MFPARATKECFQPPPLAGNYHTPILAGNYPAPALAGNYPAPGAHCLYKQALPAAMNTHQNHSQEESTTQDPPLAMPRHKIANWTTIRNM
jgi:hypothetical protein